MSSTNHVSSSSKAKDAFEERLARKATSSGGSGNTKPDAGLSQQPGVVAVSALDERIAGKMSSANLAFSSNHNNVKESLGVGAETTTLSQLLSETRLRNKMEAKLVKNAADAERRCDGAGNVTGEHADGREDGYPEPPAVTNAAATNAAALTVAVPCHTSVDARAVLQLRREMRDAFGWSEDYGARTSTATGKKRRADAEDATHRFMRSCCSVFGGEVDALEDIMAAFHRAKIEFGWQADYGKLTSTAKAASMRAEAERKAEDAVVNMHH